jgi:hypothetical protein
MLPLIEAAADRGEVARRDVAFLTDRVRAKQDRPQLYGTQYEVLTNQRGEAVTDERGRMTYLLPVVEDIVNLDRRRLAAGLGPWIEYEREMAALHGREPEVQPRSVHDR